MKVSGPVFRGQNGAIGNLTTYGMEDRAGKQFAHAGCREFPGEVEGRSPSQIFASGEPGGERKISSPTFRIV